MSSKVVNLVGHYQRQGQTLSSEKQILTVCNRKNTTATKSKSFLVLKSDANPKGIYISSLYQKGEGIYSLEYQQKRYNLTLNADDAKITLFPK